MNKGWVSSLAAVAVMHARQLAMYRSSAADTSTRGRLQRTAAAIAVGPGLTASRAVPGAAAAVQRQTMLAEETYEYKSKLLEVQLR